MRKFKTTCKACNGIIRDWTTLNAIVETKKNPNIIKGGRGVADRCIHCNNKISLNENDENFVVYEIQD